MADNYIERQYEQYEARKAAWEKKRKQGKKKTISVKPQPKDLTDNTIKLPRKAFITGGADGIGRNIVKAFCNSQYQVAFCDKNEDLGIQTAKETGAIFYHADVSNKESLENCMHELFEKWGDMDIIINNAGISEFSPITETSVEDFDKILSINLRPVFICSTRYLMSEPGSESYAASKGGIYSLTHALALSLADFHITVNCISPGWIQTNDYEQLRPEDHAQHPSRRVGKPEDIARMCLFLCQEENDFINGQNIIIDGGMTKKMIYLE